MEQFSQSPQESQPNFDAGWIPLFEASDAIIAHYGSRAKDKERVGRELRERAINHGLDPVEYGQQFWAWKKSF